MIKDRDLIDQYCRTGSEEAFRELVRRHVDLVYSVALRQVAYDKHLAEDVSQMVFTSLAQKAPSLSDRVVLGGWLCCSTRFVALNMMRNARRRRVREEEAFEMYEISDSSDGEFDWESTRPVLDQAISELKENDRDVVWLRYFEGKSFSEIGKQLGLSENTARMRLNRSIAKLNTLVSKRGITSSATALATALPGQAATAAPAGLATSLSQGALAGVATASGGLGLATYIGIMNTNKTLVVVLALIATVAAGTAVVQTARLKHAKRQLDVARAVGASYLSRLESAEVGTSGEADLDGARVSPEEQMRADERMERKMRSWRIQLARYEDPERRMDMLERMMREFEGKMDELFDDMGLTSEERAAALKLIAEYQIAKTEYALRAGLDGREEEGQEAYKSGLGVEPERTQFSQDIYALLGDENIQKLVEYGNTEAYHETTKMLQENLKGTGYPMSYDQRVALDLVYLNVDTDNPYKADLSLLLEMGANRELPSGLTRTQVESYFKNRENRERLILEEAAKFLSDEQLVRIGEVQASIREGEFREFESRLKED